MNNLREVSKWIFRFFWIEIVNVLCQVKQQLEALGGSAELRMAQRKAGPVVTDQGNLVLDAKLDGGISDPVALEQTINNIPGVLENGLFVNITDEVLVGEITDGVAGVRSLEKRLS